MNVEHGNETSHSTLSLSLHVSLTSLFNTTEFHTPTPGPPKESRFFSLSHSSPCSVPQKPPEIKLGHASAALEHGQGKSKQKIKKVSKQRQNLLTDIITAPISFHHTGSVTQLYPTSLDLVRTPKALKDLLGWSQSKVPKSV